MEEGETDAVWSKYHDVFRRPILEALEAVFRCGFDYAEIWVDHAWDERQEQITKRSAVN